MQEFGAPHNIVLDPRVLPGLDLGPVIGEAAWHAIAVDPSIRDVSLAHLEALRRDTGRHLRVKRRRPRILEVAAYAHITGYHLARDLDADVTLFDISADTLRQGWQMATADGLDSRRVRRVVGDFHALPFEDGEFDVVYIASALHHTWRWRRVLAELVRVTAKDGLLILENEPCRRELCFYGFRTNRAMELSPREAVLNRLGLLRTLAEPYLGSRPELLFGMTENQEMPLQDLLGDLAPVCRFEELTLSPGICMDPFEHAAEAAFRQGAQAAHAFVAEQLAGLIETAGADLTGDLSGPPTPLPSKGAVEAMAEKIRTLVAGGLFEPGDAALAVRLLEGEREGLLRSCGLPQLLKAVPDLPLKLAQARMFGAGVRLIARRTAPAEPSPTATRDRPRIQAEDNGVCRAFPRALAEVMDPARSLLPSIQSGDASLLRRAFGSDWAHQVHGTVHVLAPVQPAPVVTVRGPLWGHYLVYFRVYLVFAGVPWRLSLVINGVETCSLDVRQSESALLFAAVANVHGSLMLRFEACSEGHPGMPQGAGFNVSHAGAVVAS